MREKCFFSAQPFEKAQNRQRNVWKNLEKTSENLEKFGKKLGREG
jgi:tetrahydromethanopterin S-methyltransferase subunit G